MMRRPRREGVGSEIALMAVITKAMGAFLVLVVIMMPHYVFNQAAEDTAGKARQSLDEAHHAAQQIAAALGKGRLTDPEVDELLQKIEALEMALREAVDEVNSLKIQISQAYSEVARLQRTVAEKDQQIAALEDQLQRKTAEINVLKTRIVELEALLKQMQQTQRELEAEIARLREQLQRRNGGVARLTVEARWRDCAGADLRLMARVEGATSKATPHVPNLKAEPSTADSATAEIDGAGRATWQADFAGDRMILNLWLKNQTAAVPVLPAGRQCPIEIAITPPAGDSRVFRETLNQMQPIVLLPSYSIASNGYIISYPSDDKLKTELLGLVKSGDCDRLLCPLPAGRQTAEAKTQNRLAYVRHLTSLGLDGELAEELAAAVYGNMDLPDAMRWGRLLLTQAENAGAAKAAAAASPREGIDALAASLVAAGAPPKVRAALLDGVAKGFSDRESVETDAKHIAANASPLAGAVAKQLGVSADAVGALVRLATAMPETDAAMNRAVGLLNERGEKVRAWRREAEDRILARLAATRERTLVPEPLLAEAADLLLSGAASLDEIAERLGKLPRLP
jgi:TolA-binding protein